MTAIQNAQESGVDGIIRATRDGDTSGPQSVEFSVSGSADAGDDYVDIATSITIPTGQTSVDILIVPINNGIANTSSRSVTVTLQGGMDYDVGGGPATIAIGDDVDTLPVTVHQESFQLTGTGSPVNVSLTVTYTAPTAPATPGTYTWAYQVQNPTAPTGTTTWTSFTVPVEQDPDLSDVANLQGPAGWTGSVGSDTVSWSIGSGGLAPGQTETFSFTTAPREVGTATVEVAGGGGAAADLPTAPAPRVGRNQPPSATISFGGQPNSLQELKITVEITTAAGGSYSSNQLSINVFGPKDASQELYDWLRGAGFQVVKGENTVKVLGKRITTISPPSESIDSLKTITVTITDKNQATTTPVVNGNGVVVNP